MQNCALILGLLWGVSSIISDPIYMAIGGPGGCYAVVVKVDFVFCFVLILANFGALWWRRREDKRLNMDMPEPLLGP